MREILFRGKHKDNGEWVEGFYFQKPNPFSEDGLPVTHAISDIPPFGYDVDPETIGQYTGLTDKNGKKIFEGDIVSDTVDIFTVVFDEQCRFMMTGECDRFLVHCDEDCFVLGNIYDNSELLEVGK